MIFEYKKWDAFCDTLYNNKMISIPACDVKKHNGRYIVLKHDVETDVARAYELAKIENKYGHRGSYYVQAYLMNDVKNINILKKMQKMGHEISYHYDVMDSNKGNLENAIVEFKDNKAVFEKNGFQIITVCQHGNPIVERVGYSSNRDFFRSSQVQKLFPEIADIMVDYKTKNNTDYNYYSDAGRKFKLIYDPINNDILNSEDKNIKFENLNELFKSIDNIEDNIIISTHPHRWCKTSMEYLVKNILFKVIKRMAKILLHIPGMKKLMSKYYYIAKKI